MEIMQMGQHKCDRKAKVNTGGKKKYGYGEILGGKRGIKKNNMPSGGCSRDHLCVCVCVHVYLVNGL